VIPSSCTHYLGSFHRFHVWGSWFSGLHALIIWVPLKIRPTKAIRHAQVTIFMGLGATKVA
jgi:hypothetical protein